MRPDFKEFHGVGILALVHSAKGSTWKEHKYIKRLNGTYYYPDDYEGGRHLPDGDNNDNSLSRNDILDKLEDITGMKREGLTDLLNLSREKGYDSKEFKELLGILSEGDEEQAKKMVDLMKQEKDSSTLSSEDVEKLANEVIRGNFGNGQTRKDLLGEYYRQIQDRVNEIYREKSGSTKLSNVSKEQVKKGEEIIEKVIDNIPPTTKGLDYETIYSVYRKKK